MLAIDGSLGEGGGQIVRSSLALSLVTGQGFVLSHIRAGREKPGLQRQHLAAVNAAADISRAAVQGATIGSCRLTFEPGPVAAGEYAFRVGTAGSATLVLQTVLPALLLARQPSMLTVEGGTHNPFAPPFEFLAKSYLPLVNRLGPTVQATLERYGFYPAGGGRVRASIQPAEQLAGLELLDRGPTIGQRVRALVAHLPLHIARRECRTIARQSGWEESAFQAEEIQDAHGPGNVVLVEIESQQVTEVFTGFGKRGVRAEDVASAVWREAHEYLTANVPVGPHLADQILLPLGIAAARGHGSALRTAALTKHATTHIEILRQFLGVGIEASPAGPHAWLVRIR